MAPSPPAHSRRPACATPTHLQPAITFAPGATDANGQIIGDLCIADTVASWSTEGQWENAAGLSEWQAGPTVDVAACGVAT